MFNHFGEFIEEMTVKSITISLLCACLSFNIYANDSFEQALEFIAKRFESSYAFPELKRDLFNWNLDEEKQKTLERAQQSGELPLEKAQELLKRFVHTTRDYHVQLNFNPKVVDRLPFLVGGAKRVYVTEKRGPSALKVGDEITHWNGIPIKKVLQQMKRQPGIENHTDQLYAFLTLTNRYSVILDPPRQEDIVHLKIKREGQIIEMQIPWTRYKDNKSDALQTNPWWHQLGLALNKYAKDIQTEKSRFFPNARNSIITPLSPYLWRSEDSSRFNAWIANHKNKKIGLIRVNTLYPANDMGEFKQYVEDFKSIVEKMNDQQVEALILDLRNNFGGSIDYAYALASFFFTRNIQTFDFEYRLFPELKQSIAQSLNELNRIKTIEEAVEYFGSTHYYGLKIDMNFVQDVRVFFQGLANDVNDGRDYSRARPYNSSLVRPHPTTRYTGELFIVTNGWSISGADFFPALFQRNKRAILIGEKSSGAGGFIGDGFALEENGMGVTRIRATFAAGRYPNNGEYLENNGPTPDFVIKETDNDFQSAHKGFRAKVLNRVVHSLK